jgi:hypothetical protein
MKHAFRSSSVFSMLFVSLLFLSLSALPALAGEGFGMMKKTANLTRVHPPQVFIPGTRIVIHVTSHTSQQQAAAQRLQSQLESQLLANNPRLKLDASRPETIIDVALLQSTYAEKWEDRKGYQSVKVGTDAKGKAKYETQEVMLRFKVVTYNFNSTFKVHDVRNDRPLTSGEITFPYQKDFQDGNGSPDVSSLESSAIESVVNDLTHRLAPTKEVVGVLLPRGTLENASAFADAGLWSKYQDALDKIPPFAKPLDEAYRQYALGVAYEALSYGAEDPDTTLKYLEQASTHYNNAVDTNPKEGYFTKPYESLLFRNTKAAAPIARVQEALTQYQKLKEFAESASQAAGQPAPAGGKSMPVPGAAAAAPSDALTNDGVVDMLRAGLPEEIILTSIDSAGHTAFDVTPRGLIQLADAKASKRVIQRIQAVATQPKGTTKTSSAGKGKGKKTS